MTGFDRAQAAYDNATPEYLDDGCERCGAALDHSTATCCSRHARVLCHACYRRTHFVEICYCPKCKDRLRAENTELRAELAALAADRLVPVLLDEIEKDFPQVLQAQGWAKFRAEWEQR